MGHREAGKGTESKNDVPKTEWPWGGGQLHVLGGVALRSFYPWFSPISPIPVGAVGLRLPLLRETVAGFSRESTQLIISTNNSEETKVFPGLLFQWDFTGKDAEMGGEEH